LGLGDPATLYRHIKTILIPVYLYFTTLAFIPEKEEAEFFLASLWAGCSSEVIIAAQRWTNKGGK